MLKPTNIKEIKTLLAIPLFKQVQSNRTIEEGDRLQSNTNSYSKYLPMPEEEKTLNDFDIKDLDRTTKIPNQILNLLITLRFTNSFPSTKAVQELISLVSKNPTESCFLVFLIYHNAREFAKDYPNKEQNDATALKLYHAWLCAICELKAHHPELTFIDRK